MGKMVENGILTGSNMQDVIELRPGSASIIRNVAYSFHDQEWMEKRTRNFDKALNIYEVHFGSWRLKADGSWFTYDELAPALIDYCKILLMALGDINQPDILVLQVAMAMPVNFKPSLIHCIKQALVPLLILFLRILR